MGDVADMMLDGTLCEGCGCVLIDEGEEPSGFPSYCMDCGDGEDPFQVEDGPPLPSRAPGREEKPFTCFECNKHFAARQDVRNHNINKHRPPRPPQDFEL